MAVHRSVVAGCMLLLVVGACSGEIVDTTSIPRGAPAEPATGPIVDTLIIGDTSFTVHDEGGGCLAVGIDLPGLQSTVSRHCFSGEQVLAATTACGWLVEAATGPGNGGCDVTLPVAFYGQVRATGVGYVCVGTIREPYGAKEVVSARFVPFDAAGFILTAAGADESAAAYLFTSGGLRYGQPPADAPADPTYRLCEEQAPWGVSDREVSVRITIEVGATLQSENVTFLLDAGTGPVALSGGSVDDGFIAGFPLRVAASSTGLAITVDPHGGDVAEFLRPWPESFQAALSAGVDPLDPSTSIELRLVIDDGALAGEAQAVDLFVPGYPSGG